MKKFKYFFLVKILALSAQNISAMDILTEDDLSATTAKEGISVSLAFPNSTISYDQVMLSDSNGIAGSATHAAMGSLIVAPTTANNSNGIRLLQANGTVATKPVVVTIDADSNANNPVANIHISMPSDTRRIQMNPFSIYLASGSSNIFTNRASNTLRANVRNLLTIGGNGINLNMKDALGVNVQMGNTPQGHMFKFVGSISCITNSENCDLSNTIPISINDVSGATMSLGFALKATDSAVGIRLNNFYGDIKSGGLILGADGLMDKFDMNLTGITFGSTSGAADPTQFNGLKNGSIGNIGLTGVAVTDFKMTIRGM